MNSPTQLESLHNIIRNPDRRFIRCYARVAAIERVSADFDRIHLVADGLADALVLPADAIKLHLPATPGAEVPLPEYDRQGRIILPEGMAAPAIRAVTMKRDTADPTRFSIDLQRRTTGALVQWRHTLAANDALAITGLRVEHVPIPAGTRRVYVGDTTAIPAIAEILRAAVPGSTEVHLKANPSNASLFPENRNLTWHSDHSSLIEALAATRADSGWIGAEHALAAQARNALVATADIVAGELHVSAYWTRGQNWDHAFDHSLARINEARSQGHDITNPAVMQQLTFGG